MSTRDLRIRLGAELYEQFGGVVRYGPFRGMRLPAESSWTPADKCPKLLGMYEREIVDAISRFLGGGRTFVDIGAADGYFAIGFVLTGLCDRAVAFELNPAGRRLIGEMAAANGVDGKLTVFGEADANFTQLLSQAGISMQNCVVLIDTEGAEYSMLDDSTIAALGDARVVVELHGGMVTDGAALQAQLLQRLRQVFDVEIVRTGDRHFDHIPEVAARIDDERWLMASEGRPYLMEWAVCTPRGM